MKIENLEHSQKKFTFEVTPEEFEAALDKAFATEVQKVSIPGFRKGHAPRSVFEKNYGVESLFSAALDVILNDKVQEIAKDQELAKTFIGQFRPVIDEAPVRGKAFNIGLAIDVQPEVKLPDYKSIEVKEKDLVASEKEVEDAIKAIVRKDAKKADKRAGSKIAKGDYATFDFVGTVDGVEFEGGKAENYASC